MPTISLCMVVQNEEAVLERCLQSASPLVEEIILVDTGSTDHTKEIAARFTEKIYDFTWQEDISAARNFAFSKGTCDYLFWLDAADVISRENQTLFLQRKSSFTADMIFLLSQDAQHTSSIPCYQERLVRRTAGFCWEGAVHAILSPHGTIQREEIVIWHQKQLGYRQTVSSRESYCYARKLMERAAYQAAITAFSRFLEEGKGAAADCVEACLCRADCYIALQKPEAAIQSVFQSFQYALPTVAACFRIRQYFEGKKQLEIADFWGKLEAHCGVLFQNEKEI